MTTSRPARAVLGALGAARQTGLVLLRAAKTLTDQVLVLPALLSRNEHFVLTTLPGHRSLEGAADVAVFVHFDRGGEVHDYVLFYLRAIRDAGFEILFVSNGPLLPARSLAKLEPLCARIVCRRNVGYDFGAYRDGLRALGDLAQFNRVLLANDSVYGPLFDLSAVLSRCGDQAAVWGMTDSWSIRYHLQSFFLLIGREALTSPHFTSFWAGVLPLQSKGLVIRRYEVGFTQAMLRAGLHCEALFPYRVAAQDLVRASHEGRFSEDAIGPVMLDFFAMLLRRVESGRPLNPLHHFWDHMISGHHCPFIKRELLARNPARIPHAHLWERLIRTVSTYDTKLIARHLQATARDRAP